MINRRPKMEIQRNMEPGRVALRPLLFSAAGLRVATEEALLFPFWATFIVSHCEHELAYDLFVFAGGA